MADNPSPASCCTSPRPAHHGSTPSNGAPTQHRHPDLDHHLKRQPATLHLNQNRRPNPRINRQLLQTNQRLTTLAAVSDAARRRRRRRPLHRGVAGGAGLLLGEGAVRRAEPQGARSATCGPPRSAVRCRRRTAARPRAIRPHRRGRPRRRSARRRRRRRQATSWNTAGNGDTAGTGSVSVIGMASRSSSIAQVPFGRPQRSTTAGCSWPAWPTTTSPISTSAQRPGCHGRRWAGRNVSSTPAARPMMRTASNASAGSTGRPGPHGPAGSRRPARTAPTCCGCRGSDASRMATSSSVGRRSFGMRSTARVSMCAPRPGPSANSATSTAPRETLRASASSNPGSNVVASSGRSDSSGLSTRVVLPALVVGGQAPPVEDAARKERGRQYLDVAVERQRLSDRPATFLARCEAPPGRRQREHRRDDRRVPPAGSPPRPGRRAGGCRGASSAASPSPCHRRRRPRHRSASTASGRTVRIVDTGGAIGKVGGHARPGDATSPRSAGHPASR